MRSPEQVVREFIAPGQPQVLMDAFADLIRQRDAEHEALRREERGRAFDGGAEAKHRLMMVGQVSSYREEVASAEEAFAAARRAAVEGAPGGAGEEGDG